jgi:hypothetical protein
MPAGEMVKAYQRVSLAMRTCPCGLLKRQLYDGLF